MNCNIIPLIVRFQSMFRPEKHSNHVAFPPSFSALMPTSSSSIRSKTRGSSIGTEFKSAMTRVASSCRPVPRRCLGLSGRKKIPDNRINPHSSCKPTGMRHEAELLIEVRCKVDDVT